MRSHSVAAHDLAGGMYVAWQDDRDGTWDIYLQRFTSQGEIASGWPEHGLPVSTATGDQLFPGLVEDGDGGVFVQWHNPGIAQDRLYPEFVQKVSSSGVAQWTRDGIRVSPKAYYGTQLVADGQGGMVALWHDVSAFSGNPTFAQRFDSRGLPDPDWPASGVAVCPDLGHVDATTVSDGMGGIFLAWRDGRDGTYEVYVQHVSGAGVRQLPSAGLRMSAPPGIQNHGITADGAGGAIVFWAGLESRPALNAQRLSHSGEKMWGDDGVALFDSIAIYDSPDIIATGDGLGGAIVSWTRGISTYVQRVDSSGHVAWGSAPILLSEDPDWQVFPNLQADGSGGAFVAWNELRDYEADAGDVRLQRIASTGALAWDAGGKLVCRIPGSQSLMGLTLDPAGGVLVAWADQREQDAQIVAQRFDESGAEQWLTDGVSIFRNAGVQVEPAVVSDGAGGSFVIWKEKGDDGYQLRARRMDANGMPRWPAVTVCELAKVVGRPICAADGIGGLVVAWNDSRGHDIDIYAQHVDGAGTLLWGAGGALVAQGDHNAFVTDIVSDDQSGATYVGWYDAGYYVYAYAQSLDVDGHAAWGPNGRLLSNEHSTGVQLVTDQAGGVIAVWNAGGTHAGRAQRMDSAGRVLWGDRGIPLGHNDLFWDPGLRPEAIASDAVGGVVIVGTSAYYDLRAQRVTADGLLPWGDNGITLSDRAEYPIAEVASNGRGSLVAIWSQSTPDLGTIFAAPFDTAGIVLGPTVPVRVVASAVHRGDIVPDDRGGFIIVWEDGHNGSLDVFAQRLDSLGNVLWPATGVVLSDEPHGQYDAHLIPDGEGGVIAAWTDNRSSYARYVFSQRVNSSGVALWGEGGVTPVLISIEQTRSDGRGATIVWRIAPNVATEAWVERRVENGNWERLARVLVNGQNRCVFHDDTAPSGRTGYRLRIVWQGEELTSEETWVDINLNPRGLAVLGFSPNPASSSGSIAFTLASDDPAVLEVLDIAGRRAIVRGVGELGPGRHVVGFTGEQKLAPGVYLIRLTQLGRSVTTRGVVLR